MIRHLSHLLVFLAGLAVMGWIGAGYVGSNPLALSVTALIGVFYAIGALELQQHRRATDGLARAVVGLSGPPAQLAPWLAQLHPGLRDAVRLRIQGTRAILPGPALTPYIVGLLVLLGMLGTFLGMIATLRGTGAALEGAADLQAMRASLAAPVQGLGFAFGTSVAGVAASAALGLLAALYRRERDQAARLLDAGIATSLHGHSPARQREEAVELLRRQAEAMPVLVDRLQAMMDAVERRGQELDRRLAASQDGFHDRAEAAYARLAGAVEQSLKESIAASARSADEAIRPAVQAAMAGISREAAAWHGTVAQAVQQQLEGLSARFEAATAGAADGMRQAWEQALDGQGRAGRKLADDNRQALADAAAAFERHGAALLDALSQSHAKLQADLAAQDGQRLAAWTGSLEATHESLRAALSQAGAQAADRQREICDALARTARDISARTEAHASGTIAEIGKLVEAASEAPRAASEVIAELRQKLSDSLAHDNAVLQERNRLLETLDTLLAAVNHASAEQRAAIDALVATSSELLERVGARFAETVQEQAGRLDAAAAEVAGGAAGVASLGEALGAAVQSYGQSSDRLVEHLERVGGALEQSAARSDEQLAYYVAQAREVVDLSLMAQKQIMEDLRQLAERQAAGAGPA